MSICVGEVIEVRGTRVIIEAYNKHNKDILFYKGKRYQGIVIGSYLLIKRGMQDIACKIEGEYLDEKKCNQENGKITYQRKVTVKPMGYFTAEDEKFHQGIKFLPMLKDSAYLIHQERLESIYGIKTSDFVIGKTIKEDIPINLPWGKLFASHIAIFGNTGSGKSNTLAKIYTELFQKKQQAIKKSKFIVLDLNGEYTGEQFLDNANKNIIELNTRKQDNTEQNKFKLPEAEFWDAEMLSILFKATQNTQQPFIKRIIKGRKDNKDNSLTNYIQAIFYKCLIDSTSPKRETLDILKDVIEKYAIDKNLYEKLKQIHWNSARQIFYYKNGDEDIYPSKYEYKCELEKIKSTVEIGDADNFDELIIRSKLKLASDLNTGYVQFEHINPMINRIKSSLTDLKKVIKVVYDSKNINDDNMISIISLRNCNHEIKKILPLIITKYLYRKHKQEVKNPIDKTMHLIIDEAHNILSKQSLNEHESWKDYRLELFEEIIKEGRKFGMFLTLSSQRPADISPTIVSQIHNFFIHRLVNDKDLQLLDNTISTLDSLSKGMIPNLSKGGCIVTGVSFDIPLVLQIALLPNKQHRPDSEDVNLYELWK